MLRTIDTARYNNIPIIRVPPITPIVTTIISTTAPTAPILSITTAIVYDIIVKQQQSDKSLIIQVN